MNPYVAPCIDCGERLHPHADVFEKTETGRRCFGCVLVYYRARIAALEAERAEVLRWANEFSARFGQYADVEEALNELRALVGKENG